MNRFNYSRIIAKVKQKIANETASNRRKFAADLLGNFMIPAGVMLPGIIIINATTSGITNFIAYTVWCLGFIIWILLSWIEYWRETPASFADEHSRGE